jgi:hypothetical protein
MANIFKDISIEKTFEEYGYIIIDIEDKQNLISIFEKIQFDLNKELSSLMGNQNSLCNITIHSTFLDEDKNYKKIVQRNLEPIFNTILDTHILNYKTIQLNIFNKPPNAGFLSPHQNITTVDEDLHTSLSIWIPLQDTSEANGCIYLLPKSNKKIEKYRNPYIYWPPLKFSTSISDYNMIPIELKMGQAIIFDDSLVHGSPTNTTETSRIALHAICIPKGIAPIYAKKRDENTFELIEVSDDFWFNYSPGDIEPSHPIIKKVNYTEKIYSKADFIL